MNSGKDRGKRNRPVRTTNRKRISARWSLKQVAAQAMNWKIAYDECNGLNMVDMLDCLKDLGLPLMRDMRAQMGTYDTWGGPHMARIRFAMDVVEFRKIATPPSGLPSDPVDNARVFLARNPGHGAATGKQIHISVFWTEAARGESLSPRLIQRARELLRENHTGFELNVSYFHGNLDFGGGCGPNRYRQGNRSGETSLKLCGQPPARQL